MKTSKTICIPQSFRYELENQGYAIKLDYINKGRQAKLSQQERALALKAEQVEAEALRAEKEREKQEAEEPEKQALDKYRQIELEQAKEKEEGERSERTKEASQVNLLRKETVKTRIMIYTPLLQAFDWLDSNQDGKLQVEELQTHVAFDQNQDGTVSIDEAKFFLHNEEEMEKSEFLTTGWPLAKPFLMKAQGLDTHSQNSKVGGTAKTGQAEDSTPEVNNLDMC